MHIIGRLSADISEQMQAHYRPDFKRYLGADKAYLSLAAESGEILKALCVLCGVRQYSNSTLKKLEIIKRESFVMERKAIGVTLSSMYKFLFYIVYYFTQFTPGKNDHYGQIFRLIFWTVAEMLQNATKRFQLCLVQYVNISAGMHFNIVWLNKKKL